MKNLLYTLLAMLALVSCSKEEEVVTPPTAKQYTLTISAEAGGTVSTEGGLYNEGSKITVTATPDDMYLFKEWSDGSTQNPREITVTSNLTLKASFIKKKYRLSVTVEGEGRVQEEVIIQGSTSETTYNAGTTVRLTATPNEGWVFAGWSGDVESEDLVIEVSIEKGTAVVALFVFSAILPVVDVNDFDSTLPFNYNWGTWPNISNDLIFYDDDSIPDMVGQHRKGYRNYKDLPVFKISNYAGKVNYTFDVQSFKPSIRDSMPVLFYDMGDLNFDTYPDFFLLYNGEIGNEAIGDEVRQNGTISYVLLSDGEYIFKPTEIEDAPTQNIFDNFIFDIDFDGKNDLVYETDLNGGYYYKNLDGKNFIKKSYPFSDVLRGEGARGDWNGDGREDYILFNPFIPLKLSVFTKTNKIDVSLENLGYENHLKKSYDLRNLSLIDQDLDSDLDLVVTDLFVDPTSGEEVITHHFFRNNDNLNFEYLPGFIESNPDIKSEHTMLWVRDIDGDGDQDLYFPIVNHRPLENPIYWFENEIDGFKINTNYVLKKW